MSKETAAAVAVEQQGLGHTSDRSPEVATRHVGRFSEGIAYFRTPDRLRPGRFSEGVEQLPETPRKLHLGRFSEGIEKLPETALKLRRGSFADGYEQTIQRRSNELSHRHLSRPAARRRHMRGVRDLRARGTGA